jgi:hypothetical protein
LKSNCREGKNYSTLSIKVGWNVLISILVIKSVYTDTVFKIFFMNFGKMETLGLLIPHNFNEVSGIFYVVKNAIQRTAVWYNGDLCGSCVILCRQNSTFLRIRHGFKPVIDLQRTFLSLEFKF